MSLRMIGDMLKTYLKFNPVLVLMLAIAILGLILFFSKRKCESDTKKTKAELLGALGVSIYVAFLCGVMILNRKIGQEFLVSLSLFWSYKQCGQEYSQSVLLQIIYNILIFIPWPILFAQVFPKMKSFLWGVGSALVFSAFIEVTQLVFKLGVFEFDDMFHNTLGALIGYAILTLVRVLVSKYRLRKRS